MKKFLLEICLVSLCVFLFSGCEEQQQQQNQIPSINVTVNRPPAPYYYPRPVYPAPYYYPYRPAPAPYYYPPRPPYYHPYRPWRDYPYYYPYYRNNT